MASAPGEGKDPLSPVLIGLMRGVLHAEEDPALWQSLRELEPRVRDYFALVGLELLLDESEGYATLRQKVFGEGEPELPRLIPRRKLSYPVSLLLVLLRKKLLENDSAGGETRLILKRQEIEETVRLFLRESANEARLSDQIGAHINRIVEMGFLRRLRGDDDAFEVRRILKAFVDAQWLSEFDRRLLEYREAGESGSGSGSEKDSS